jgi:hypothetical protein
LLLSLESPLAQIRGREGAKAMARRTIYVSDLTGQEIKENDAATLTITYADARRGVVKLDVNASEVEDLAGKGTKQARRGRRPKQASEGS